MRKRKKTAKARKGKIAFAVIIEIAIMAVGVICCILPLPWRLVVPIIIGAREIIIKAIRVTKKPAEPIVYCNGKSAPQKRAKSDINPVEQAKQKSESKTKTKNVKTTKNNIREE